MIPFPRLHIAESVVNRIQNTLEDSEPLFPSINTAPIPPTDPIALGRQIEEETAEPTAEVVLPEDETETGIVAESIFGGSPLAGAVGSML